jgi:branched-chain amino acid transport system substrate-binding protein
VEEVMKNKKLLFILAAVAILAAVLIIVTQSQKFQEKNENIIKIGAILPLTGLAGEMGKMMMDGLNFAMDYWNNVNKDKKSLLSIKIEDTKSNPNDGVAALKYLLSQGYKYFIIPHSIMAMTVRPILIDQPDVIAFLDASHPDITNPPNPRIFRHSQNASWEAINILNYLLNDKNISSVIIFYLNDEYGRSFIKEIQNSFGARKIRFSINPYEMNTLDFRSVIFKSGLLSEVNSAAVVVGSGKPMGVLIKMLREQGYKGKIFAAMGYIATGARNLLSDTERKNIFYTDLIWENNPWLSWLEDEYTRIFKKDPPGVTKLEFLSGLLMATVIETAGTSDVNIISTKIKELAPKLIGVIVTENGDLLPKVILKEDK